MAVSTKLEHTNDRQIIRATIEKSEVGLRKIY